MVRCDPEVTSLGESDPSRLLVLFFSDIVGPTDLKSRLGMSVYKRLLEQHEAIFKRVIDATPAAQIINDNGDGYFMSFRTASDAVRASLLIQHGMAKAAWTPEPLTTRIGLHVGEVTELDMSATGKPKLVALAADLTARIMSLAKGGQILLSRAPFDDARQFIERHPADENLVVEWMAHGPYLFKGEQAPHDVFEVGAKGFAPLTAPVDSEKARRYIRPGDEETLGWRPAAGKALPDDPEWVVKEKLGEGGFGEVWLAEHRKVKSRRVFKFCFDAERLRALKREVTLFRVMKETLGDRRDIARVIDYQLEKRPYYIEMEYAPLGNLSQWAQEQGGIARVPVEMRIELVARTASALSAAHSVGVLHKDIKPSNILIAQDSQGNVYPRLTDFGIGVLTHREALAGHQITLAGLTQTTLALESSHSGTRMYSPPEIQVGRPFTTQGDIYALGVLLYQMAAGDLSRPLGQGWQRDVSDELLREDIAACSDVDPEKRLSSAAELAERLESLEARRDRIERVRKAEEAARLSARRRRQVQFLSSGFAAVFAIAVVMLLLWRDARWQKSQAVSEKNRANAQEAAATRAAARAEDEKRKATAALARDGWRDYYRDDLSLAFLQWAQALENDPRPAHRHLVSDVWHRLPRLCAGDFSGEITLPLVRKGRVLKVEQKAVHVIDAASGKPLYAPIVHEEKISHASFSPDGSRFVTADWTANARVWETATGTPLTPPMQQKDVVRHVAFNADASRMVIACADHTGRIWDANAGMPMFEAMKHGHEVRYAVYSPDESRILTTSYDGTARVWDAATAQPVTPPIYTASHVRHASFSPDGGRLVTANWDTGARVWDAKTGEPITPAMPHEFGVIRAAFSGDGTRVVTITLDRFARVWDAATGKPVTPPMKHNENIEHAAFSADGSRIITATDDRVVRVWEISPRGQRFVSIAHEKPLMHGEFSSDGSRVVTASTDKTARVWDAATGEAVTGALRHEATVQHVSFNREGTRVVTSSDDGTARVWDARTGAPVGSPMKHERLVRMAVFSPDGRRVLTASEDKTARVWDAKTGEALLGPIVHKFQVFCVAFSPDGSRFLTASEDHSARVWETAAGEPVTPPMEHQDAVLHACFSSDGRRIATSSKDRSAIVWDASTGKAITPPMEHQMQVLHVSFSADGARIVTAGADKTARVWDAASGKAMTPSMVHQSYVNGATFSSDGSLVLTASTDRSARIWDATTGNPVSPPLEHGGTVRGAVFSRDDAKVLTICADGGARIWDFPLKGMPPADVLRFAELISARRFNELGAVITLTTDEFKDRFDDTLRRYPEEFAQPRR